MVEQRIEDPRVTGSIPVLSARLYTFERGAKPLRLWV